MKIQENYFYRLDNSKDVKVVWKKYDKANILEIGIEYPTAIVDLDRFSGIPITEEWLIKFGFKCNQIENEFRFSNGCEFTIGKNKNSNTWFCYEIKMDGFTFLNHIHQLQDLYFALTQRELTIA